MATIYPRKAEMDATYLPQVPAPDAAFRFTPEFLQLRDQATGEFSSLWLRDGILQVGEGEA